MVFVGLASTLFAQISPLAPFDGVLLLKNGNTLSGRITQEGEVFTLAMGQKSTIRMPADRVEFACRSMEQAYLKYRALVGTTTVRHHVELANWCLDQQLSSYGNFHLEMAVQSDPNSVVVTQLVRRYEAHRKKNANSVRKASYEMPVVPPQPEPSIPQAVDLASQLPNSLIYHFTRRVQPLLLNNCALSNCHSEVSSNSFRLVKFDSVRSIPRRMTLKNMNASLEFVNFQQLANSELVLKASTEHGGVHGHRSKLPPEQVAAIYAWVRGCGSSMPRGLVPSTVVPATFNKPLETQPTSGSKSPKFQSVFPGNANMGLPGAPRPFRSVPSRPVAKQPTKNDPFDPEVFNDRYHPDREQSVFRE